MADTLSEERIAMLCDLARFPDCEIPCDSPEAPTCRCAEDMRTIERMALAHLRAQGAEPVAWMYDVANDGFNDCTQSKLTVSEWPDKSKVVPLFRAAPPAERQGFVSVPKEPTHEQANAAVSIISRRLRNQETLQQDACREIYRAMIAAVKDEK